MNDLLRIDASGFHGKLPTHGDFVQRHVAADFALAWDHWLERALHAAQRELGDGWDAAYANAPVWRFAFAAGVCGESACIGVLAPSVDRVGRQFPLAVVRRIAGEPLAFACGNSTWFDAIEAALSSARQGRYASLDDFDRALQDAATPVLPTVQAVAPAGDLPLADHGALAAWAGALAHRTLAATVPQALSYWWHHGARAQLRWQPGLPPPSAFRAWLGDANSAVVPTFTASPALNLIPDDPFASAEEPAAPDAVAGPALPAAADPLALFGGTAVVDESSRVSSPFVSAAISDRGNRRKINQDAFLDAPGACLWAVADGMGGWADGDKASRQTIAALEACEADASLDARVAAVRAALLGVNAQLRAGSQVPGASESGSTVVVMLGDEARLAIVWAGDSRAYRLRDGELRQLTRDHSLQQEAAAAGDASGGEDLPSNVITRAVGGDETLELDVAYDELQPGDRYLLCSDGLYRQLEHDELAALLRVGAPDEICETLCRTVLQRTADDNLTAVVIERCG